MRIGRKLDASFGAVVMLLIAVAVLANWSADRSRSDAERLEQAIAQEAHLGRLTVLTNRQLKELSDYTATGHDDELADFYMCKRAVLDLFDDWDRMIAREAAIGDHDGRNEQASKLAVASRLRKTYLQTMRSCDHIVNLIQQGDKAKAVALMKDAVMRPHDSELASGLAQQLADEQARRYEIRQDMARQRALIRWTTLAVVVPALISAGVLSTLLTRSIAVPLQRLRTATVQIGQGRLDTRIEITSQDEIGELADGLSTMAADLRRTLISVHDLRREVAERERIERAMKETNDELKQFAHIVSHDLKAPLRGIMALAEWIAADYNDKLDDTGRRQLDLLVGRAQRMHNLIDGILQYSRVGRAREQIVRIDLNELVREIIDSLDPPEHISIAVDDQLPVMDCEQTPVTQLFQNLLSNAIKYMDKPEGRIWIRCHDEGDLWQFSIGDNGPGIQETYFDKIFQIFETLSQSDERESTGVGLAVVKRIVQMHGGRIWLESEIGAGSTFFFTVPKTWAPVQQEQPELCSIG